MNLSVNDRLATALLLLSDTDAVVSGEAQTGRRVPMPFSLSVASDPVKGPDAVGIVLLLHAMEEARKEYISSSIVHPQSSLSENLREGMELEEAEETVKVDREIRAGQRKEAGQAYDSTDEGQALIDLRRKYAGSKRATFKVPGTNVYATLASIVARVHSGKVASGFASSLYRVKVKG